MPSEERPSDALVAARQAMVKAQTSGKEEDKRRFITSLLQLPSDPSDTSKGFFVSMLPKYFAEFSDLQDDLVNGLLDLCEHDSEKVRIWGIQGLATVAKADRKWVKGHVNVLLQLLESPPNELKVVKDSLNSLLLFAPQDVVSVMVNNCTESESETGIPRFNIIRYLFSDASSFREQYLSSSPAAAGGRNGSGGVGSGGAGAGTRLGVEGGLVLAQTFFDALVGVLDDTTTQETKMIIDMLSSLSIFHPRPPSQTLPRPHNRGQSGGYGARGAGPLTSTSTPSPAHLSVDQTRLNRFIKALTRSLEPDAGTGASIAHINALARVVTTAPTVSLSAATSSLTFDPILVLDFMADHGEAVVDLALTRRDESALALVKGLQGWVEGAEREWGAGDRDGKGRDGQKEERRVIRGLAKAVLGENLRVARKMKLDDLEKNLEVLERLLWPVYTLTKTRSIRDVIPDNLISKIKDLGDDAQKGYKAMGRESVIGRQWRNIRDIADCLSDEKAPPPSEQPAWVQKLRAVPAPAPTSSTSRTTAPLVAGRSAPPNGYGPSGIAPAGPSNVPRQAPAAPRRPASRAVRTAPDSIRGASRAVSSSTAPGAGPRAESGRRASQVSDRARSPEPRRGDGGRGYEGRYATERDARTRRDEHHDQRNDGRRGSERDSARDGEKERDHRRSGDRSGRVGRSEDEPKRRDDQRGRDHRSSISRSPSRARSRSFTRSPSPPPKRRDERRSDEYRESRSAHSKIERESDPARQRQAAPHEAIENARPDHVNSNGTPRDLLSRVSADESGLTGGQNNSREGQELLATAALANGDDRGTTDSDDRDDIPAHELSSRIELMGTNRGIELLGARIKPLAPEATATKAINSVAVPDKSERVVNTKGKADPGVTTQRNSLLSRLSGPAGSTAPADANIPKGTPTLSIRSASASASIKRAREDSIGRERQQTPDHPMSTTPLSLSARISRISGSGDSTDIDVGSGSGHDGQGEARPPKRARASDVGTTGQGQGQGQGQGDRSNGLGARLGRISPDKSTPTASMTTEQSSPFRPSQAVASASNPRTQPNLFANALAGVRQNDRSIKPTQTQARGLSVLGRSASSSSQNGTGGGVVSDRSMSVPKGIGIVGAAAAAVMPKPASASSLAVAASKTAPTSSISKSTSTPKQSSEEPQQEAIIRKGRGFAEEFNRQNAITFESPGGAGTGVPRWNPAPSPSPNSLNSSFGLQQEPHGQEHVQGRQAASQQPRSLMQRLGQVRGTGAGNGNGNDNGQELMRVAGGAGRSLASRLNGLGA